MVRPHANSADKERIRLAPATADVSSDCPPHVQVVSEGPQWVQVAGCQRDVGPLGSAPRGKPDAGGPTLPPLRCPGHGILVRMPCIVERETRPSITHTDDHDAACIACHRCIPAHASLRKQRLHLTRECLWRWKGDVTSRLSRKIRLQLQLMRAERYAQDVEFGMWRSQAISAREKAQAAWRRLDEQYQSEASGPPQPSSRPPSSSSRPPSSSSRPASASYREGQTYYAGQGPQARALTGGRLWTSSRPWSAR